MKFLALNFLASYFLTQAFPHEMEVRTSFPRFQEYFTLIVQFKGKPTERKTTARMYVGRYFTEKGEFDEASVCKVNHVCLPE